MSSPPVLLILTGSFGHGHNTAASNLEAAFRHQLGTDVQIEVVDFFGLFYPRISSLLQKGYTFAINNAPTLWKQLYRFSDTRSTSRLHYKTVTQKLACFLQDKQPSVVVSTFPIYSTLLEQLFPKGHDRPFRFYTVITDSISISAMWCQGHSDLIFVTDAESRRVVMQQGVPGHKILAHGFPIRFAFQTSMGPLLPPDQVRPRILYIPTTQRRHVKLTIDQLAAWSKEHDAEITIVLGQNEKRLGRTMQSIREQIPPDRLTILGWVKDIPQLMTKHHVTITKAGGASVNEALGAQCPIIINYVVPGQEEGNAQLVLQNKCGRLIHAPQELPRALSEILVDNDAAVWRGFRANLSDMNRATASLRIATEVTQDCGLLLMGKETVSSTP